MSRVILAVICLSLLGAGSVSGQEKKPLTGQLYTTDYFPLKLGSQWHYRVTAGEKTTEKLRVTVDALEDFDHKVVEEKKDSKKETSVTIVRARLGFVSGDKQHSEHVAVFSDGVYRFTSAGKEITPPLRFFKLPLKKGESWVVNSASESTTLKGTFLCDDETVQVPAGKFDTKKVSSVDFKINEQPMTAEYWFAADVGIVKQRVRVGVINVTMELERFVPAK